MNATSLFHIFEHALSQMPFEASCAYLAFYRVLPTDAKPQLPTQGVFFSVFFSQASEICENESQRYFLSESAAENIKKANEAWESFLSETVDPFLRQNGLYKQFSRPSLRLVASDAMTFYEWTNDVGYLQGDNELRKQWLDESPLAE